MSIVIEKTYDPPLLDKRIASVYDINEPDFERVAPVYSGKFWMELKNNEPGKYVFKGVVLADLGHEELTEISFDHYSTYPESYYSEHSIFLLMLSEQEIKEIIDAFV